MATRKKKSVPKLKFKKPIPYAFVLDELDGIYTFRRPMFGAHALYRDEKIVLILRQGETYVEDNGVWVATLPEHHASLRAELPSLRRIYLFSDDTKETAWQNIPESSPTFEEEVLRVCELVRRRDPRVGKVPKAKKSKKTGKKET